MRKMLAESGRWGHYCTSNWLQGGHHLWFSRRGVRFSTPKTFFGCCQLEYPVPWKRRSHRKILFGCCPTTSRGACVMKNLTENHFELQSKVYRGHRYQHVPYIKIFWTTRRHPGGCSRNGRAAKLFLQLPSATFSLGENTLAASDVARFSSGHRRYLLSTKSSDLACGR